MLAMLEVPAPSFDWGAVSGLAAVGALLVGVVVAALAVRQLKSLAQESYASTTRDAMVHLHTVLGRIGDHGLWKYFYCNEPQPPVGHEKHDQVAITAEMLVDVLEENIEMAARVPSFESNASDWMSYAEQIWLCSPAVRKIVSSASDTWANDFARLVMKYQSLSPEEIVEVGRRRDFYA